MLAAESFEVFLQQRSHSNDTLSHSLDFAKPLLIQCRIIKDLGSDPRAMHWGIGIKRSDEDLELRIDTLLLFCIFTYNRECADTFTVEALCFYVNGNSVSRL